MKCYLKVALNGTIETFHESCIIDLLIEGYIFIIVRISLHTGFKRTSLSSNTCQCYIVFDFFVCN